MKIPKIIKWLFETGPTGIGPIAEMVNLISLAIIVAAVVMFAASEILWFARNLLLSFLGT